MHESIKPICNESSKCLFDVFPESYLGSLLVGTNSTTHMKLGGN
jgi:hypothetical protein